MVPTGSVRRLRRAVVLVACAAMLGWSMLAATHLHAHDDDETREHGVATCVLCAATPTGAAPPAMPAGPAHVPWIAAVVASGDVAAPVAARAASYLIRGPPAV